MAAAAFGPLSESPAKQVGIDVRCVLLLDGSVRCRADQAPAVTLPGSYSSIDMGSYTVCGLDLDGMAWCTDLNDESLTPWSPIDGTYSKLAASDVGVCVLLESGEIDCADGSAAFRVPGTYTDLDAGDWTVCAIRIDGSMACWQADALGKLEMWLIPEGW